MAYTETTSCRTGRFLPADPRYTWQIMKVRTWVLKGEELWAAHLPSVHNGWHHHVKDRDLHLILFLWAVSLQCGQLSTSVHLLISDSSFTAHAEGPEYWPTSASLPISSSIWRSSLHKWSDQSTRTLYISQCFLPHCFGSHFLLRTTKLQKEEGNTKASNNSHVNYKISSNKSHLKIAMNKISRCFTLVHHCNIWRVYIIFFLWLAQ